MWFQPRHRTSSLQKKKGIKDHDRSFRALAAVLSITINLLLVAWLFKFGTVQPVSAAHPGSSTMEAFFIMRTPTREPSQPRAKAERAIRAVHADARAANRTQAVKQISRPLVAHVNASSATEPLQVLGDDAWRLRPSLATTAITSLALPPGTLLPDDSPAIPAFQARVLPKFDIRDTTFRGSLQRFGRKNTCEMLRARLATAQESADALLNTMARYKCSQVGV
jgi:hypothetical protein